MRRLYPGYLLHVPCPYAGCTFTFTRNLGEEALIPEEGEQRLPACHGPPGSVHGWTVVVRGGEVPVGVEGCGVAERLQRTALSSSTPTTTTETTS